jgi:hypothetical protein
VLLVLDHDPGNATQYKVTAQALFAQHSESALEAPKGRVVRGLTTPP